MLNRNFWDPFREMIRLSEAMDRLFEESFVRPTSWMLGRGGETGYWVPIDIVETDNDYIVKASLPGFKPEDIQVNITGETLTISGNYKAEEPKDARYVLRERRLGSFSRTIALPVPVEADKAVAHFEHGELTLTLPKVEEVRTKQIKISVGEQPQLSSTAESAQPQA